MHSCRQPCAAESAHARLHVSILFFTTSGRRGPPRPGAFLLSAGRNLLVTEIWKTARSTSDCDRSTRRFRGSPSGQTDVRNDSMNTFVAMLE